GARGMTLGLLPALGGGLGELASTGQAGRLLDGYLARYVGAFERVLYFSYLVEALGDFTRDPALLGRVELVAPPARMTRGRRAAAAVIATTPALEARAARLSRNVHLIPNGVDTVRFAPVPRASRGGVRRVLYVGRFAPEKNLETVVTATARLARTVPLRLVLVGAGPLHETLRAQAAGAGLE